MATVDRSLVAELPLFKGLGLAHLDEILAEARSVRYPRGGHVFEQDQDAEWFFVLLQGNLRVVKLTPTGQQVVVRTLCPAKCLGSPKR